MQVRDHLSVVTILTQKHLFSFNMNKYVTKAGECIWKQQKPPNFYSPKAGPRLRTTDKTKIFSLCSKIKTQTKFLQARFPQI